MIQLHLTLPLASRMSTAVSRPSKKRYGGRESSTRCNFRKHIQIEKVAANQENIFISLTAGGENAYNTNK